MECVQRRKWFTPTTTISQVFIGLGAFAQFECFTLEDLTRTAGEGKVPGATSIPFGRYRCELTHSEKFGRVLPLLWNVEEAGRKFCRSADGKISFEGIRIHVGNGPEDTLGCVLPGRIRQPDNLKVLQSTVAFNELFAKLQAADARKEAIWWTIEAAAQTIHA